MDPSKFSVRLTNPTMVRQERFSNLSNLDNIEKMSDYRSSNRYDEFAMASASWCAPRKVQPVESSASTSDEINRKELRTKKPTRTVRNIRRRSRASQQTRIEELSRPRVIVRRIPRSHEIHSKICPKLEKDPKIVTSSSSDLTVKSSIVIEKRIRHRQPTDRIAKLAEPKVHEPTAINLLGKVDERALFAVASKRIAELAMPKSSSMMQSIPSEKRDPFGVNPQALRAICPPRIELLARPKKLATFSFSASSSITAENLAGISG